MTFETPAITSTVFWSVTGKFVPSPTRTLFCECVKDFTAHDRCKGGYCCRECGTLVRYFINFSKPGEAM